MKRSSLIGALVVSLAMSSVAMAGPGGRGHGHHRESVRAFHDARHDVRRGAHARAHRSPYRSYNRYGAYHRPHGYYVHRWVRGERLPIGYYASPYLIADYYVWGLRVPPGGYHWVRVDGDAVLAAVATGIVLDTVFHVFN